MRPINTVWNYVLWDIYVYVKSLQSCLTLGPHGPQPARNSVQGFCPWDSSGKNTGVNCHAFLQGVFPTRGSNLRPYYVSCIARWALYNQHYRGSPMGHALQLYSCVWRWALSQNLTLTLVYVQPTQYFIYLSNLFILLPLGLITLNVIYILLTTN